MCVTLYMQVNHQQAVKNCVPTQHSVNTVTELKTVKRVVLHAGESDCYMELTKECQNNSFSNGLYCSVLH